jgi:hypothetical protein
MDDPNPRDLSLDFFRFQKSVRCIPPTTAGGRGRVGESGYTISTMGPRIFMARFTVV